ncbi:Arc/MetJ-type ribon-helix-helix transcriptional regulator [Rhizobium sp. BK312]|jgi:hypothetical protein|uniref:conjugal transfer protein TraC n=1 Tax=Rhizobium sp. BK312 TaxID=2587080 RepID=UPI000DC5F805|nr:conjugal transfer protein TraC [Rhizobium sp. BK312]MBB3429067.1 Arc/MetJ-type ribon-helix-helix transcriptional regulator [Rhizobium sp. BK312]
MKKPSSKIREEITRLQEQLKAAETREAERIGRIALKAGLGEIEIEENALQAAFEDVEKRFRQGKVQATGKRNEDGETPRLGAAAALATGAVQSSAGEV